MKTKKNTYYLKVLLIIFLWSIYIKAYSQDVRIDTTSEIILRTHGISNNDNRDENRAQKTKMIDERRHPGSFIIETDQDYLFFCPSSYNEDRNYTQGTAFTYSHPHLINSIFYWPLRKIEEKNSDYTRYSSTFTLGGTAFTPRVIDSINPIVGDRPFVFLLYISTAATWVKQKSVTTIGNSIKVIDIYNTFRINYGLFGTNLGYEFQSFAHKHIVPGRPEDPQGWDHQIGEGGSPTILIEYNRFRPLITNKYVDLGANFGGSVGYYDRIFAGAFGRAGYLKKENQAKWNNGGWAALSGASYQLLRFKDDSSSINNDKSSKSLKNVFNYLKNNSEVFVYGKVNTTLMLRNSMLVGQRFWESEYTLEPEWVKTGLIEYEWGAVIAFEHKRSKDLSPRTWGIKFRQVYRSPEFDSGIFPERWHYFGSIGLFFAVR